MLYWIDSRILRGPVHTSSTMLTNNVVHKKEILTCSSRKNSPGPQGPPLSAMRWHYRHQWACSGLRLPNMMSPRTRNPLPQSGPCPLLRKDDNGFKILSRWNPVEYQMLNLTRQRKTYVLILCVSKNSVFGSTSMTNGLSLRYVHRETHHWTEGVKGPLR